MGKYSPENELIPSLETHTRFDTVTHYTSITTLFKILRNGKILFNRIDKVNDLLEKENLLKHENYRRVFVSCFSIRKYESLPMWSMYTHKDTGVMLRFKLRSGYNTCDLFTNETFQTEDGKEYCMKPCPNQQLFVQLDAVQVKYSNVTRFHPITHVKEENKFYDIPYHFGLEKIKAWSYEKEIRFRAIFRENISCTEDIPEITRLFAKLNFSAIESLTIIFNPWINKEDWRDILQDFISKLKIDLKVEFSNSRLHNKIK